MEFYKVVLNKHLPTVSPFLVKNNSMLELDLGENEVHSFSLHSSRYPCSIFPFLQKRSSMSEGIINWYDVTFSSHHWEYICLKSMFFEKSNRVHQIWLDVILSLEIENIKLLSHKLSPIIVRKCGFAYLIHPVLNHLSPVTTVY